MVDAAGEDHHHPRADRKAVDDLADALVQGLLHVALQDIVLPHGDGGETVHGAELRGGQDHAPETAGGADVDLVSAGHQGPDVDDVPDAPGRGRIGETIVRVVFVGDVPDEGAGL